MIDVERSARPVPGAGADVEEHRAGNAGAIDRLELARVAFVALAACAVWLHIGEPVASVSVIGIAATLVGGYPIFKEALANVIERRMTMELSMTIALAAALSIGQVFTALVITAFVLAAEILEHLTVARGRSAIGDLMYYLPRSVIVRRDGAIHHIAAMELRIGDAVLVNPGAIVPADGHVLAGMSFVDESTITGESLAAEKVVGSRVFAGTLNASGVLEVRAERLGRDTSFGRIIDAIESAEASSAPIERLADRLSGYLVYIVLAAAALTLIVTRNIVATISVIIVAGACGIAAGTPLAVLGAIGRAARAGVIVKGGRYLEALAAIDTVLLDKTGTATFGKHEIRDVIAAPGATPEAVLARAAIAERRSEHPLGQSIVAHAQACGIAVAEPEAFAYEPGRGIRAVYDGRTILVGNAAFLHAEGVAVSGDAESSAGTAVHVADDGRLLGTIAMADTVRPDAVAAVADLKAMAIRTVLMTGDVERVASAVGRRLGVDDVLAELLPEQKSAQVAQLVAGGRIVAMVGDGVNDAPALSRATVGVAMGSGTDVARESADVVMLGNSFAGLVETVRIARRMKSIVMQNFVGTLVVDAIGIALAAYGLISPLPATLIHVGSELAFILNATRMLPMRRPAAKEEESRS